MTTTAPAFDTRTLTTTTFTTTRDGTTLPWSATGDPDGPAIVFLHGLSDSLTSWDRVRATLPETTRAVAITLRGHGDADRPVDGYDMADLADDVVDVLDDAGIREAIVVGHSMGTQVALHLAAARPDRVRRLVLVGAFVPTADPAVVATFDEEFAGLDDPVDPDWVRGFQASTAARAMSPGVIDDAVSESLKVPTHVWQATWAGLRQTDAAILDAVTAPTTLVWGDRDDIATRAMQEELLARLSQVDLVTIAGAGHAPHWEDPIEFVDHLTTLAAHDAGHAEDVDADGGGGDEVLMERLFQSAIGTLELFGVHLGVELGLYEILRDRGACTVDDLARHADIDGRYALEWLEQQAVAGLLRVESSTDEDQRRFRLPAAHVDVLARPEAATHVAPFAAMVVGIGGAMEEVVAAYRSGDGVPYAHYGAAFRRGQGGINRPAFSTDLVSSWLPGAGLHHLLERPGARVADLGCGLGWSTIAVAHAHPTASVVGIDADEPSILEARHEARARGVDVEYRLGRAEDIDDHGPFDVVLMLEVLHDLADPVGALAATRRALAPGGRVLVADEAVAESFTAPGDDLERMMYGWSITHCLPACRDESTSAAIGTAIRPDTVADLAERAGFARVERVDLDAGFFHLYELVP